MKMQELRKNTGTASKFSVPLMPPIYLTNGSHSTNTFICMTLSHLVVLELNIVLKTLEPENPV